jgi:hypothetical protein
VVSRLRVSARGPAIRKEGRSPLRARGSKGPASRLRVLPLNTGAVAPKGEGLRIHPASPLSVRDATPPPRPVPALKRGVFAPKVEETTLPPPARRLRARLARVIRARPTTARQAPTEASLLDWRGTVLLGPVSRQAGWSPPPSPSRISVPPLQGPLRGGELRPRRRDRSLHRGHAVTGRWPAVVVVASPTGAVTRAKLRGRHPPGWVAAARIPERKDAPP